MPAASLCILDFKPNIIKIGFLFPYCFFCFPLGAAVRPRFRVKLQNVTAHEGGSALVHCQALGDPPPSVQWDKNGRVDAIDPTRFKASCLIFNLVTSILFIIFSLLLCDCL